MPSCPYRSIQKDSGSGAKTKFKSFRIVWPITWGFPWSMIWSLERKKPDRWWRWKIQTDGRKWITLLQLKDTRTTPLNISFWSMMSSPQGRPSPVAPMPYWRHVEDPLVLWPLPVGCLDNIVLFCADKYEHVKIRKAFFSFTGGVFFYAMRQKNQPNRRFKGYTPPCTFKYFPQNEYYFFR